MKDRKTKVAVVTPVHNRREITLRCLRSLVRMRTGEFNIQIIVVDDGSTDGTSDAIQTQFPDVKVIPGDGTLWFTEGTNVGVRAALRDDPDYILMINDDQIFDQEVLMHLVHCAEENPRSVVGSLLLLWDQPHKLFQVSPIWDTWSGGWKHWRHQTVWTVPERAWSVDLIVGNCVLVPRAAFGEVGLMNSRWFPNFGDAEFTPRLKKHGWKLLIEPKARVFCQPNTEPSRLRAMSLKNAARCLVIDRGHPHNLVRRFLAYWSSAPNPLSGSAAFAIFLVRAAIGRSHESGEHDSNLETPLSKRFATFPKCPE